MRIGVVARAIFVGQPLGLYLHVKRCGGLEAHLAQIELLDDVEHLQRGQALRVRAHGIDIDAAIVRHQRRQSTPHDVRAGLRRRAIRRCA